MNENENTKPPNLWDSAKAEQRGTCTAINACFFLKKGNIFSLYKSRKRIIKLKANRRK